MKESKDFFNEFNDKIKDFKPTERNFLTNVFREMFCQIPPFFISNDRKLYMDYNIEDLVEITNDKVLFRAYQIPNGKKLVAVNFLEDGTKFVSKYEFINKGEDRGKFTKEITRFPLALDNTIYNTLQYRGYTKMPFFNTDWIEELDQEVLDGISNGSPVSLFTSHKYITIGKNNGQYTYGVINYPEDEKQPTFIPFIGGENEPLTPYDAKELATFVYAGNIPKSNIVVDLETLPEME